MSKITHEGQEYILKSAMEKIITDRIAKVARRANEAENQALEFQARIDANAKSLGTVDILSQQVTDLQAKLGQSERKYARHSSISRYGMTDPEMIEAVEWSYDRSMSKMAKKDRPDLDTWLSSRIQDPSTAPAILRPHLESLAAPAAPATTDQPPAAAPTHHQPPAAPPMTNAGRLATVPDQPDILTRAMGDQEFYKANHDQIRAAWDTMAKGFHRK